MERGDGKGGSGKRRDGKRKGGRRWIDLVKREMDVEFFSCVHSISTVFVYGFILWLDGTGQIPYRTIVEIMVLGYLAAWAQKLPFLAERPCSRAGRWIREVLWSIAPMVLTAVGVVACGWFAGRPAWAVGGFYGLLLIYYVMVWAFLRGFYERDTEELNRLLSRRKGEGGR